MAAFHGNIYKVDQFLVGIGEQKETITIHGSYKYDFLLLTNARLEICLYKTVQNTSRMVHEMTKGYVGKKVVH